MTDASDAPALLAGLTVVELASVLAGPGVGQFLAELGATVVKVENVRTGGDVTRRWKLPAEPAEADVSSYFACCNWGKQSVALDLQAEAGRRLFYRLAGRSDVVLSSFKPGDAERLGVDAAALRLRHPGLIVAQLTGYGEGDPRPGYDAVVQAESGFTGLNGEPDGPPLKLPVALMDLLAGHQLKEALLAALWRRARTGAGATIHVSLLQAAVSALANQATGWLVAGVAPRRMGSAHPSIAPYGTLYRTADGTDVVLAVGTDRQFAALCAVLGCDALAADARFATNPARVRHRAALDAALGEHIGAWRRDALLARLAGVQVPAGAVHTVPEALAAPGAADLVLRAPGMAGLRQAAFTLDGAAPAALAPPPRYGQHTREVLSALGCTDAELQALAADGVIFAAD